MNRRIKSVSVIVFTVLTLAFIFGFCQAGDLRVPSAFAVDEEVQIWSGETATSFSGGTGSVSNPYQISTGEELAFFGERVALEPELYADKHYILTQDIYLNHPEIENSLSKGIRGANNWIPIGKRDSSTNAFKGVFDGQGFTVRGIYYEGTLKGNFGLFYEVKGTAEKNAIVRNLSVSGFMNLASGSVGAGIASLCSYSQITNCHSFMNVEADVANIFAGIVGTCFGATIKDCSNHGNITLRSGSGAGIVIYATDSTIESCSNYGNILSQGGNSGGGQLGGIVVEVALNYTTTYITYIKRCENWGDLTYMGNQSGALAGGIVAKNESALEIAQCANYGKIYSRSSYAAGMVGYTSEDSVTVINNCYNAGTLGGLLTFAIAEKINIVNGFYNTGMLKGTGVSYTYRVEPTLANSIYILQGTTIAQSKVTEVSSDINIAAILGSNDWEGNYKYLRLKTSLVPNVWKGGEVAPSGDGTEANPYIIKTPEELRFVATHYINGYIELANDIYLNDTSNWNDSLRTQEQSLNQWMPIGSNGNHFQGVFDGKGYTIHGLYIKNSSLTNAGLFDTVLDGVVKNLHLRDAYIESTNRYNVGGIVGYLRSSVTYSDGEKTASAVVQGCSFAGSIVGGNCVGGIVGVTTSYVSNTVGCAVIDCYNSADIQGAFVGGIVGHAYSLYVGQCYNTGSILSNVRHFSGEYYVGKAGGIVGVAYELGSFENNATTIINCYNKGEVRAKEDHSAGGIVGELGMEDEKKGESVIYNCINSGDVGVDQGYVGGLIGILNYGKLYNSYSKGILSGYSMNTGGLMGKGNLGSSTNCYYLKTTADSAVAGRTDTTGAFDANGNVLGMSSTTVIEKLNRFAKIEKVFVDNIGREYTLYHFQQIENIYATTDIPYVLIYPKSTFHTVTYEVDGVVFHVDTIEDGNLTYSPPDPVAQTGYDFDGWYNGSEKWTFDTPIFDNLTLTAKWALLPPTVSRADKESDINGNVIVDYTAAGYQMKVKASHILKDTQDGERRRFVYQWFRLNESTNEYEPFSSEMSKNNLSEDNIFGYNLYYVRNTGLYRFAIKYVVESSPEGAYRHESTTQYVDYNVTINRASPDLGITMNDWIYGTVPSTPNIQGNITDYDYIGGVIEYRGSDEDDTQYRSVIPTEAGAYRIRMSFAETDNCNAISLTADFNILKADYMFSVFMPDWTYGTTASAPVIGTVPDEYGEPIVEYRKLTETDDEYTLTKPTVAGNYIIRVSYEATNNYNRAVGTASFDILKAPISFVVNMADWVYGQSASDPVISPVPQECGTPIVEYREISQTDADYTLIKPTNAGSYIVRVRYDQTDNYISSFSVSTFEIIRAELSVSLNMNNWVYGEESSSPTISGLPEGYTNLPIIEYRKISDTDADYTITKPINAGKYLVRVSYPETENYNAISKVQDFEILKATPSFTISMADWIYGDTASEPVISTLPSEYGAAIIEYRKMSETDADYTTTKPTNSGSYIVRVSYDATTNYNAVFSTASFEISRKSFSLNWENNTYQFDGTHQYPNFGLPSDVSAAELGITITFYKDGVSVSETINADHYLIVVTITNPNYIILEESKSYEITPVYLIVDDGSALVGNDITYNGYAQVPPVTIQDGNLQNIDPNILGLSKTVTQEGLQVESVNIGNYKLTLTISNYNYYFAKDGDNYIRTIELDFEIVPALVSVDWGADSDWIYNGTAWVPSPQFVTLQGDDEISYTINIYNDGQEIDSAIDVGEYYFVLSFDEDIFPNKNYMIPPESLTLRKEIKRAQVDVLWDNTALVYNGNKQIPSLVISGIFDRDKEYIDWNVFICDIEGNIVVSRNAGNYIALLEFEHPNYEVVDFNKLSYSFSIYPQSLEITDWAEVLDTTSVYNGQNQTPTPTFKGLLPDDKISYNIIIFDEDGNSVQEMKDVRRYILMLMYHNDGEYDPNIYDNHNYTAYGQGIICERTITPRTVKGIVSGSVEYYDESPTLNYSYEGFCEGDKELQESLVPVSHGYTQGLGANQSCVITTDTITLDNYIVTFEPFELTVKPATLIINVKDGRIIFGEPKPVFEVEYEGFRADDSADKLGITCVVKCDYTTGADVGEYELSVEPLVLDNYTIITQCGKLIVEAKSLTDQEAIDLISQLELPSPQVISSGKLGDTLDKWRLNEGWSWVDNSLMPDNNTQEFLAVYDISSLCKNYDLSNVSIIQDGKLIKGVEVSAEPTFWQSNMFAIAYSLLALAAVAAIILVSRALKRKAALNKQAVDGYLDALKSQQDTTNNDTE